MRIILIPVLLLILSITSACTRQTDMSVPDDIIHPDTMVNVMVDVNMADALHNIGEVRSRYNTEQLYSGVYKKYGISRRAFDESMRYYSQHHKKLSVIYERVEQKLKQMEQKRDEAKEKAEKDKKPAKDLPQ